MPFEKPKALPCLHTFCEDCLRDYTNGRGFDTAGKFPCPVCREEIKIPDSGIQAFPDNYIIASLRDTVDKSKKKPRGDNSSTISTISESDTSTSTGDQSFIQSSDSWNPNQQAEQLNESTTSQENYVFLPTPSELTVQEPSAPQLDSFVDESTSTPVDPQTSSVEPTAEQDTPDVLPVQRHQPIPAFEPPPAKPPRQSPTEQTNYPVDINYPNLQQFQPPPYAAPTNQQFQPPPYAAPINQPFRPPTSTHPMNQQFQPPPYVSSSGDFSNLRINDPVRYPEVPRPTPQRQSSVTLSDPQFTPCDQGLLLRVGQYGPSEVDFRKPYGLGIGRDGEYVVTDRSGSRILVFSSSGFLLARFACDCKIADIAMTKDNHILVAVNNAEKAIMRQYNFDGHVIARYGDFYRFDNPSGVGILSNNHVVVSNMEGHNLIMFTEQRKFSKKIGWKGSGDNHFLFPQFLCVNKKDDIVVSDSGNNCIKVYKSSGEFKRRISQEGSARGSLTCPMGVATDSDNNIFVADAGNYRVQMFTSKGVYVKTIIEDTDLISPDAKPLNVAVTQKNDVVVMLSGPDFAELRVYKC